MKEAYHSGSLATFDKNKSVMQRITEVSERTTLEIPNESNVDVMEDSSSSSSCAAEEVQKDETDVALVQGIQCRSQQKCKAEFRCGNPDAMWLCGGDATNENRHIFHTWLFLETEMLPLHV